MKLVVLFCLLGIWGHASASFTYKRDYRDGNTFSYKIVATSNHNGQFYSEESGVSSHKVFDDGDGYHEHITWKSFSRKDSSGIQNFDTEALDVTPYRLALGKMRV